jgi:4-amino-4-deoxy-L-arabinose transferase-like glycosyltransferase
VLQSPQKNNNCHFTHFAAPLAAFVLLLRALTLEIPALTDPSESRYATVAQEMLSSGDWLTPRIQLAEGLIPYMGKPPLHFWLTAISFRLFGLDEWSSRLPSFLALLVVAGFTGLLAWRLINISVGALAPLVCLSSVMAFYLAGSCSVDVTLSACLAGAMTSFALCVSNVYAWPRRFWGLTFFACLAFGVLTKGPVALVLAALPLSLWLLFTKNFRTLKMLPWFSGIVLFFAISSPWFYLQAKHTPGFLYYYFINENILRYLVVDYHDKYGSGHIYPRGMAWAWLATAFLPWTIYLIVLPFLKRGIILQKVKQQRDPWFLYCLLWGITPAVFFTLARQLAITYLVPGIAGLSIVTASLLYEGSRLETHENIKTLLIGTLILACWLGAMFIPIGLLLESSYLFTLCSLLAFLPLVYFTVLAVRAKYDTLRFAALCASATACLYVVFLIQGTAYSNEIRSTRDILSHIANKFPSTKPTVAIVYGNPYSAYFYAKLGTTEVGKDIEVVRIDPKEINELNVTNIVLKQVDIQYLPQDVRNEFREVAAMGKWSWLRKHDS